MPTGVPQNYLTAYTLLKPLVYRQLLELKREEFAKRMAECDARQSELKKKCKDLRKRVQTKEQEVQETRSKIDRATKKQQEEKGFQVHCFDPPPNPNATQRFHKQHPYLY